MNVSKWDPDMVQIELEKIYNLYIYFYQPLLYNIYCIFFVNLLILIYFKYIYFPSSSTIDYMMVNSNKYNNVLFF